MSQAPDLKKSIEQVRKATEELANAVEEARKKMGPALEELRKLAEEIREAVRQVRLPPPPELPPEARRKLEEKATKTQPRPLSEL